MAYGVTGNTSGFGPEESRFEPQWANKKALTCVRAFLFFNIYFNIPTKKVVKMASNILYLHRTKKINNAFKKKSF